MGGGLDIILPQLVDRVMKRLSFEKKGDGVYEIPDPDYPIYATLKRTKPHPDIPEAEFGEVLLRFESPSYSSFSARYLLEWEAELHSKIVSYLSADFKGESEQALWLEMNVVLADPQEEYAMSFPE